MTLIRIGLLILVLLISKEILVFNEESLVLVSFTLFVAVVSAYTKDMVISGLQERATQIEKELSSYEKVRKEILEALISYHEKQTALFQEITKIFEFSKVQIQQILAKRKKALHNQVAAQVEQKLKRIATNETKLVQEVQAQIATLFAKAMKTRFVATKGAGVKGLKDSFLKEGIRGLQRVGNR